MRNHVDARDETTAIAHRFRHVQLTRLDVSLVHGRKPDANFLPEEGILPTHEAGSFAVVTGKDTTTILNLPYVP